MKSLNRYVKLYFLSFIGCLIVAVPGYVLVFTVLPHYVRYTEPKPIHDSLLLVTLWAALMSIAMPIIQRYEKRKKAK